MLLPWKLCIDFIMKKSYQTHINLITSHMCVQHSYLCNHSYNIGPSAYIIHTISINLITNYATFIILLRNVI